MKTRFKVALILVDGLGVGENDPAKNPCARLPDSVFSHLTAPETLPRIPHNGRLVPLDACLGVEGIPQSATGQTTLLTGTNAAALIGRHLFGFPNDELRELLMRESVFRKLRERGYCAGFINAYRPVFFELGETVWKRPLSATTWAARAGNIAFNSLKDVVARRAIYQEFTNSVLADRGLDVPIFTPAEAGRIFADRARGYDFLLFEYFQTDIAGHARDIERAAAILGRLDEFVKAVLNCIDITRTLFILTSDHGNIEDLSVRSHTKNKVMTLVWGTGADEFRKNVFSIADIVPFLLNMFESGGGGLTCRA